MRLSGSGGRIGKHTVLNLAGWPPWINYEVSDLPIVIENINPTAIALAGCDRTAGLCEIVGGETEGVTFREMKENLAAMTRQMYDSESLKAVLIAATKPRLEMLERCCDESRVDISGHYLITKKDKMADIVVMPSKKEVWIYARANKDKIVRKF